MAVQIPNEHVFRHYDIRGVANTDFPREMVTALGRALGTLWTRRGKRRVALGQDCRLSSPSLKESLLVGLRDTGMSIVDLGMVPSPVMYFSVFHMDLDGGVQVTGSHNPPDENGFKMMLGKDSLFGAHIEELKRMIESDDFHRASPGTVDTIDPLPDYAAHLSASFPWDELEPANLPFAVDTGNGAAGPALRAALESVGLEPHLLFTEPDGRFPNHHPDPSEPNNLTTLQETVRKHNLRFGVALDGDGDRIAVVDERGHILWGDRLLTLFARNVLQKHPGAAIIGEVKCSQTLYDDIAQRGGQPIVWKTGHSLIKAKMKESKALLAGEMSGHMFFADRYFGFDDAIYATLRFAELAMERPEPVSQWLSDLPETRATPEIRIPCPDAIKFDVVRSICSHYEKDHQVVTVDGARIHFGEGWGLVRASNTQPMLVLRFEAPSQEALQRIQTEVETLVLAQIQDQSPTREGGLTN